MNSDGDLSMGMSRNRVLLVLTCVLLGLWLWIAFAKLVVPAVIESAYRGESLPVLNSLMVGRATHSVDEYLRDWEELAGRITIISIVFGLPGLVLFMVTTSSTFFSRFVGEATPGTLGAMRAWICGILFPLHPHGRSPQHRMASCRDAAARRCDGLDVCPSVWVRQARCQ